MRPLLAWAPGDSLPALEVRARNLFRDAPNRIHDDRIARTYGFAAGLVAGTTVHGYLARVLVDAWGPAWLERGTARLELLRPVFEDDRLLVRGRIESRGGSEVAGELSADLEAVKADGQVAARAVAGLAWGGDPVMPDPADWPVVAVPATRVPATAEALAALSWLGSPVLVLTAELLAAAADELDDPDPRYRGAGAVAHPALLLQQANRILAEHVALGPWLHVASDLAHGGLARAGDTVVTRGRVARLWERKGRAHVELDVLVTAARPGSDARPVLHVRHTAIYRLPEPAPGDRHE
jgi:hypothetical protein